MKAFQLLKEKIETKTAGVGTVGLGYVGLPLAVEFAKAGLTVTGIDVQEARADRLNRGESYVQDVPALDIAKFVAEKRFHRGGGGIETNIDGARESPALDVILPLKKRGAVVSCSDPFVPKLRLDRLALDSEPLPPAAGTSTRSGLAEATATDRGCWEPLWRHNDSVELAIRRQTGSAQSKPPDAATWTGSTTLMVKRSKISTFIHWRATRGGGYAWVNILRRAYYVGEKQRNPTRNRST